MHHTIERLLSQPILTDDQRGRIAAAAELLQFQLDALPVTGAQVAIVAPMRQRTKGKNDILVGGRTVSEIIPEAERGDFLRSLRDFLHSDLIGSAVRSPKSDPRRASVKPSKQRRTPLSSRRAPRPVSPKRGTGHGDR